MAKSHQDDTNSACLKCEKEFAEAEVAVSVLWWVGYQKGDEPKTLHEQVVYRYCYPCGRTLDLQNMRVFQLDKVRFRLEGSIDLPEPKYIATCGSCGRDVLEGKPYAILRVVLEFQQHGMAEELCEMFRWIYCSECAPRVDLDNIFVLEAEEPAHLLELAQQLEREQIQETEKSQGD